MPIPFKFDSCKNFATNLNAANLLGLASKKCSKHFTLNNTFRFLIFILVQILRKKSQFKGKEYA